MIITNFRAFPYAHVFVSFPVLRPSGLLASCWRARVRAGFDQYIIILDTLENRNFLSW